LISGKKGTGIDTLLETILLLSELEELPYDDQSSLAAPVIEAKLDPKKGILVSTIVKVGTLKIADTVCTTTASCKVRALYNDAGISINEAKPGMPVQILGFQSIPFVGDLIVFGVFESQHISPLNMPAATLDPSLKRLNVIVKADTAGSLEAILGSFSDEVYVVSSGTGDITESDVLLGSSTKSIILGFNAKVSTTVAKLADAEGVIIKAHKIIYELLEYIEKKVLKLMEPSIDEDQLGTAKVLKVFDINGDHIAGSIIESGRFEVGDTIHLVRIDVVKNAKIRSIRIGKDEVKIVETGKECGLFFSPNLDVQQKDVIIAYKKKVDDI
jgi:translation initiation factor IF-2